MKAGLTEDGYFSGDFTAYYGNIPNSVEVDSISPYDDENKRKYCKLVNGEWVYDEVKYNKIIAGITLSEKTTEEKIVDLVAKVDYMNEAIAMIILEYD